MTTSNYYGTRSDMTPPPGYTRRAFRNGCKAGRLPGAKLPGRGGWVVSTTEWDAWVLSRRPVIGDIRAELEAEGFVFSR